jgi:hypothetical protein
LPFLGEIPSQGQLAGFASEEMNFKGSARRAEMRRKSQLFTFALFACCLSAQADVIFSNITGAASAAYYTVCQTFGPGRGGGYDQHCGFSNIGGGKSSLATEFTPTADFTLTDVVFVASQDFFSADTFIASVNSDVNGVPGSAITEIASGSVSSPGFGASPPYIVTVDLDPVTLTAGTPYFLTLESPGLFYWLSGGSSSVPTADLDTDGFGTTSCTSVEPLVWCPAGTTTLQFQIDGSPAVAPAPEPAPYLPVMAVLTLCLFWVKYHRKASQDLVRR